MQTHDVGVHSTARVQLPYTANITTRLPGTTLYSPQLTIHCTYSTLAACRSAQGSLECRASAARSSSRHLKWCALRWCLTRVADPEALNEYGTTTSHRSNHLCKIASRSGAAQRYLHQSLVSGAYLSPSSTLLRHENFEGHTLLSATSTSWRHIGSPMPLYLCRNFQRRTEF